MSGIVRAAGGLVVGEPVDGARTVAVIHRPQYDDWTFPKGKLEDREPPESAALREVFEETGLRARLARDLGSVEYRDRSGRPKVVRYWAMERADGAFAPNAEVDELRWLTPADAVALLTYQRDRDLLQSLEAGAGDGTAYLLRHARAGRRDAWKDPDDLRPLSKAGRRQARKLVRTFADVRVDRIASGPAERCLQTVRPLAEDRELPVETFAELSEGAPLEDALSVLDALAPVPALVCSHGDVIPSIVLHLASRGAAIVGDRDWKKGSTWVLERREGRVATATYLPPPEER